MNGRITGNDLLDSMQFVAPDLILGAEDHAAGKKTLSRPGKRRTLAISALAACLCAVMLILGMLWPMLKPVPAPPVYTDIAYSASEIGDMLSSSSMSVAYDGVATNVYTKVYAPKQAGFFLPSRPENGMAPIYCTGDRTEPLCREELDTIKDTVLPRLLAATGASDGTLSYRELESICYEYATTADQIYIGIAQYQRFYTCSVYASDGRLSLNGVAPGIDQTLSDEDILASLGDVRQQLIDLFGCSFADARVRRIYGESSSVSGADEILIYFYNESDSPLNQYREVPVTDHICLWFDHSGASEGDKEDSALLWWKNMRFRQFRIPAEELYIRGDDQQLISLDDAEILLANGYVFGFHACPLCMAGQKAITFDSYDYVGFTYMGGDAYMIPFYVFYKDIGKAANGNRIYAMTYVCALPLSGYEAYYESQQALHPKSR